MIIDTLLQFLMDGESRTDYLSFIIFTIPGCLAACFGFCLIKEKNKKNIKGCVGLLSIVAVLLLSTSIEWRVLPELSFLIMTIAVILIYIPASRFLMFREGLTPKSKGEFVGKGIILIISWQIWLAGVQIAKVYGPKSFEATPLFTLNAFLVDGLNVFGPIIIAWVFYKISMRVIKEDKAEQSESSNPAPLDT